MTNEQVLTDFMRAQYSDAKLAELLAWTEDGGLTYHTCCCFIGVLTADHPLRREGDVDTRWTEGVPHYAIAVEEIPDAEDAEEAFWLLGKTDADRRAKLIPLIKAEMARREAERSVVHVTEAVCA